jgi:hypothetical protein
MLGRMRNVTRRWRAGSRGWPAAGVDLLDGLEAYYRLDGDLADSSANGRDLSGLVTYTGTGVVGSGLNAGPADISGQSVAFSDLSLSFWVRFGGTSVATAATQKLAEAGGDTLAAACARNTRVVTVTPMGQAPVASAALAADVWHHVAVVCGSGVLTLYIDGASAGVGTAPAASAATGWQVDAVSARVNCDEWGFWSRALSAAEVASLYNGGDGFDPTA